jgi:ABC-type siderophore export system fused ATPase/permease subunit
MPYKHRPPMTAAQKFCIVLLVLNKILWLCAAAVLLYLSILYEFQPCIITLVVTNLTQKLGSKYLRATDYTRLPIQEPENNTVYAMRDDTIKTVERVIKEAQNGEYSSRAANTQ